MPDGPHGANACRRNFFLIVSPRCSTVCSLAATLSLVMENQLAIRAGRTDAVLQKARILCRYHTRGSCSKGDACQFTHEGSGGSASSFNIALGPAPLPEPSPRLSCRYFAGGNCAKGDSCPFEHGESPKPSASVNHLPLLQPHTDSRSQLPCQFFAKGYCRNSDACPFAHSQMGRTEEEEEQEPDEVLINVRCPKCII